MKISYFSVWIFLCRSYQVSYSLAVNHVSPHTTTPKPTPEKAVGHYLAFHYTGSSLEPLLLMKLTKNCFVMPLTDQDTHDIHTPKGLEKLEDHMVAQVSQHHFYQWTYDDYEVRDGAWSMGCEKRNGTLYRVYRI